MIDGLQRNSSSGVVNSNEITENVLGTVDALVQFSGYSHRMPIRLAPTFDCEIKLAHDFADIFDFEARYKRKIWRIEDGF